MGDSLSPNMPFWWKRAQNVQDKVAPGFEHVKTVFEEAMKEIDGGAQVSVMMGGKPVVSLYGVSRENDGEYSPASMQHVMSSSKVLTSLVVAMLCDRGVLRYDQRISDVWPEYGCNGKEETTIAHLMRHEAGLSKFSGPVDAR